MVLEFLNLVVDEARSSNPSFFYMIVLSSLVVQPISHIPLIKADIEIVAKITLVTLVGIMLKMFVHVAWFFILTIVARSLSTSAYISLSTPPFWALAPILSILV